jgi:hypothetical protein
MTRGIVPRYRFPRDADASAGADATPARDEPREPGPRGRALLHLLT